MEGHPEFISVSRLSAMGLSDDAQIWSYGEVFFGEQLLDGARVRRRGIPIHGTLFELGFGDFLKFRRASGARRLFPEYDRATDDSSWSKRFSKYFKRFRELIGVARRGVKFHSLRHNVEDALRNANVRKEVRDAIQGHAENGVSRETKLLCR